MSAPPACQAPPAPAWARLKRIAGKSGHPIFARCWTLLDSVLGRDLEPLRARLLDGLSGRVIEIGAGTGANFAHYPPTVTEVLAVEPEPYLRERARRAARRAPVTVRVLAGHAEELEAADGELDGAVCCLVLCSVADQRLALAEIARVLRAGGELRFLEHVRADGRLRSGVQAALDGAGIWPALGGGCHCSRATLAAIEQAGFAPQRSERVALGPQIAPTNPVVLGVARRTG